MPRVAARTARLSASAVAVPVSVAAALRESVFVSVLQIQHIISQNLRRFLFLEVQRAADCHDTALMNRAQTALIHIREHDNLCQSEQILQIEESHHLIILGDQGLLSGNHAAHHAFHSIADFTAALPREAAFHHSRDFIAALLQSGFPGSKTRDVIRGQATDLLHFFLIAVERMIGQIDAKHLLFQLQLDVSVKRRDIRQPASACFRGDALRRQIEERHLPLDIFFGRILRRLDEAFVNRQHSRAVI